MQLLSISTRAREQAVDITRQVQAAVAETGIASGIAVICVAHTTAAVTINENADPDVMEDVMAALTKQVPRAAGYEHSEGNSDAHIKSALVGQSVMVPVEDGQLQLGTWQGIYFLEFDGPRSRKVMVQVMWDAGNGCLSK